MRAGWQRRLGERTASTAVSSHAGHGARDSGRTTISPRLLRRYAGVLTERGLSKTTVARKLASIRGFYRHLQARGAIAANPADLVATPKRDAYLPRVLKPGEVADVLERIPTGRPLDIRDRAIFELAYGAGLRAEELTALDLRRPRSGRRGVAGNREGVEDTRRSCGRANLASARALPGSSTAAARRARVGQPDGASGFPVAHRPPPVDLGCAPSPEASDPARGRGRRRRRRTLCATHSRPTCSKAARTCERSRSSSVTPA